MRQDSFDDCSHLTITTGSTVWMVRLAHDATPGAMCVCESGGCRSSGREHANAMLALARCQGPLTTSGGRRVQPHSVLRRSTSTRTQ